MPWLCKASINVGAQLGAAGPDAGFGKRALCCVRGAAVRQARDVRNLRHGHIAEPAKRVAQVGGQTIQHAAQPDIGIRVGCVGALGGQNACAVFNDRGGNWSSPTGRESL